MNEVRYAKDVLGAKYTMLGFFDLLRKSCSEKHFPIVYLDDPAWDLYQNVKDTACL